MRRDILCEIHQGVISIDEAYEIMEDLINRIDSGDEPNNDWWKVLGMDRVETGVSLLYGFEEAAKARYDTVEADIDLLRAIKEGDIQLDQAYEIYWNTNSRISNGQESHKAWWKLLGMTTNEAVIIVMHGIENAVNFRYGESAK